MKPSQLLQLTTVGALASVLSPQLAFAQAPATPQNPARSENDKNSYRFDFGGPNAVQPGYVAVGHRLPYSAERGYGWLEDTGQIVRDRGQADALSRDFVGGASPATFRVTGVRPGLYLLTLVSGDMDRGDHVTQVKVGGSPVALPVLTPGAAEMMTLKATVRVSGTLDLSFDAPQMDWMVNSFDGPQRSWVVNALSLTPAQTEQAPEISRQSWPRQSADSKERTLFFNTKAPGEKKAITHWGLDTAWPNPDNMRRGLEYMGKDQVDVIRVAFPTDQALVNGDLPPEKKAELDKRIAIAKMAGDKPWTMLPDTERGSHAWFKNGKDIIPERWVQAMTAAQRHYGKKLESVEAFNEPDYGWGQGSIRNLNDILGLLQKSPDFAGVQLGGPSTLNSDAAETWYQPLKNRLQRATTHSLGGTFNSYVNFYVTAGANGQIEDNPEAHNLVEVITGAEYGLQSSIWWGTAELARGEFVKAVKGDRLAYAEDRPRWSAAAVYRAPNGKIQGFLGNSERMGQPTTYRFVSQDRAVYFNGDGPRRDFAIPTQRDQDAMVNITWGTDIQPKVGGRYVLVNRQSGKVLEVAGESTADGASLQQSSYKRKTNQQWDVAPLVAPIGDQSYFTLRALHSGKSPDVADWNHDEGGKVQQWGQGESQPQQWFFDYAGDNYFYIRNRWSAKCLGVAGSSQNDGANVQQFSRADNRNLRWRLVPVSELNESTLDFVPPASPTRLTATAKPLSIDLKWTPNREADLASYTVLRSAAAAGPYDTIARGITASSFTDNGANQRQKYFYVVKAVDHSLNQSATSAPASATPTGGQALTVNYTFDGNASDSSGNANQGELQGSPVYGPGPGNSQALVLDGNDDYVRLPAEVANSSDLTVSAWVYWDGGSSWQRIFDLGNDESQFLLLTPSSNSGKLRLAVKNGGQEAQIEAPQLPKGQWTHIAVTLNQKTAKLYVDGAVVASSQSWPTTPNDFKPLFNYIGKSQFAADPLFKGKIDNFQIYNYALTLDQITKLMRN
jgi:hypothetical protein